jgi:hypothetical protein
MASVKIDIFFRNIYIISEFIGDGIIKLGETRASSESKDWVLSEAEL